MLTKTSSLFHYNSTTNILYQLITALLAYFVFKIGSFYWQRHKRFQILKKCGIPGPKPSLWSGSINETFANDYCFYQNQEWAKQYGKTFGAYIGDIPYITTTDLNLLKKIFVDPNPYFLDRSIDILETHLTHSIFFAKQPRWKIMRKTLASTFSKLNIRGTKSTEFLENSLNLMTNYIDDKFTKSAIDGKLAVNMQDLLKSTTLHLINELVSELPGLQVKENEENVKSLDSFLSLGQKGVVNLSLKLPLFKSIFQFIYDNFETSKFLGSINAKVDNVVEEQFAKIKKMQQLQKDTYYEDPDEKIINKLTKLHYENKLTRKEVIGNVEAILIGGYDTTSTQLTYILWALAKHPKIQEELRNDLLINGAESEYLDRVIKETMRLYPSNVIFSQRVSNSTVKIDDNITIPEGSRVVYHHFLMNRDPEIWKDPLIFDPSRFEGDILEKLHPAAYQPFGFSKRRCLGANLAELEMKLVICELIVRYKFHLKSPMELKLKNFTIVLSEPQEKIKLELEKIIS